MSCKFLTRPVTWSDDREIFTPIQARFNPSQSGGSGQQDHHHHHHTGQQHDGEEQDNNSNHDSDEGGGGGGANKNDPAAPNNGSVNGLLTSPLNSCLYYSLAFLVLVYSIFNNNRVKIFSL